MINNVIAIPLPVLNPNSIYTISYTSGTTGQPKGAILKHSNIIAVMAACQFSDFIINEDDRHLSYLPLAHIFEKVLCWGAVYYGAVVGFYTGDI